MSRVVSLGEVVSIAARQVDPRDSVFRDLALVNGENIESGTGRLLYRRSAASEGVISPKYLFEAGDVLYSKLRPYLRKAVVAEGPGLCSADMYPLRPIGGSIDPNWLVFLLLSGTFTDYASQESARARMPKLNREQLLRFKFVLPDLEAQRQLAARTSEQLVTASRIRFITESRHETGTLGVSALVSVSTTRAFDHRPSVRLDEITRVVGSTSTVSDGDAEVLTVTSGCLTPAGFVSSGLRPNRMRREAVDHAILAPGEILVSRSNTEDLVGRTARYSGDPPGVVATDLVFRVIVDESMADGAFVSAILAGLQLQGYWKQRSSGASSTMKKITKVQLGKVVIPLPPLVQQREIAQSLGRQLEVSGRALSALNAEAEAARALSKAILISEFAASSI